MPETPLDVIHFITDFSICLNATVPIEKRLETAAQQIQQRWACYQVLVYLYSEQARQLVVAAGSGQIGAEMKSLGHIVAMNAAEPVARAANRQDIIQIDDVRQEVDWQASALLPDTLSVVALPIVLPQTGQLIGVLDLQANRTNAWHQADWPVLRTLAAQLAFAVQNTHLLAQTEEHLQQAQAGQKQYIEQIWQRDRLRHRGAGAAHYSSLGTALLDDALIQQARRQAIGLDGPAVLSLDVPDTPLALLSPVKLRGVTIGNVQLHGFASDRSWTDDDLAVVEAVADAVAQTVETLRLFDETQEQATREYLIAEISNKMRRAPDLETLLHTTVRELGQVLGANNGVIRLQAIEPDDTPPPALPSDKEQA